MKNYVCQFMYIIYYDWKGILSNRMTINAILYEWGHHLQTDINKLIPSSLVSNLNDLNFFFVG